jgi:hypothetical protein
VLSFYFQEDKIMSASKPALVASKGTRRMAEATTDDALTFLRAVGNSRAIRTLLATAGYTNADSERGWALVRGVVLCDPPTWGDPALVVTENPVAKAIAQIDTWRTTGLSIARSALMHLHPEQGAFLLQGLDISNAVESVVTASIFLERLQQLETGKDRKATRKDDLAALATLAARGLTKAEQKRLGALVKIVETQAAPVEEVDGPTSEADARLLELRAWLTDWRHVAKIVITRRDLRLNLGIGKRRTKKTSDVPSPAPLPVVAPQVFASRIDKPGVDVNASEESGPESRAA